MSLTIQSVITLIGLWYLITSKDLGLTRTARPGYRTLGISLILIIPIGYALTHGVVHAFFPPPASRTSGVVNAALVAQHAMTVEIFAALYTLIYTLFAIRHVQTIRNAPPLPLAPSPLPPRAS